jgi:hypothetical protein
MLEPHISLWSIVQAKGVHWVLSQADIDTGLTWIELNWVKLIKAQIFFVPSYSYNPFLPDGNYYSLFYEWFLFLKK